MMFIVSLAGQAAGSGDWDDFMAALGESCILSLTVLDRGDWQNVGFDA